MSSDDFKQKGNAAFSAGNFDEAIGFFTQAIELDGNNQVLYSNRSACYASLHEYQKALDDAELCVALKPDWVKGYSRKGLAEFNLRKYVEATETYHQGLKLDPENKALQEGLAQVMQETEGSMRQNRLWGGLAKLMQNPKYSGLLESDPQMLIKVTSIVQEILKSPSPEKISMALATLDPRMKDMVYELLGLPTNMNAGQADVPETSSGSSSGKAAGSSPASEAKPPKVEEEETEAEQLKKKGNEHYKKREFEQALECYDMAIAANPMEILYLNNKAAVFMEQKKFDEALAICQKALDMKYEVKADYSKVAKIYNRMSSCYKMQGDYKMAIQMLEKSLTEDNNRHTRTLLKDLERELEKKTKEEYINPELSEASRLKGNDFFKDKRYPEAKLEYDEAIKRLPTDAKLYSNRAAAYMHLLEYPSALLDIDKCLELDPTNIKAYTRKGQCHHRMKDFNKAITAYQKGLTIDPSNDELRRGLNETMRSINNTQQSDQVDSEQVERAMADPEIQAILADPQFRLILQQVSEKPDILPQMMNDPKIADGLRKLMGAGIVRFK